MTRPEFHITLAGSSRELQQILSLQDENLIHRIDEEDRSSEGFLTLRHSQDVLEKMHRFGPSVIVKKDEEVIAYALTMYPECRRLIPDLEPMFALFDSLLWKGEPLNNYSFYLMGQVCIAKPYRGKGLFEAMYHFHRHSYQSQFDLLVTEIATRNHRSLRAHLRVGFEVIHIHRDELDEWAVVGWDWQ